MPKVFSILYTQLICILSFYAISTPILISPTLAQNSQIILTDTTGKTQSAVELKADGTADISAVLSFGNERLVPAGSKIYLMKLSSRGSEIVSETSAESNGEVLFTNVTEGSYRIKIACDEYNIDEVSIAQSDNSLDDSSISSENLETINIQDTAGTTRAVREVSPGTKSTILLKSGSTLSKDFSGIKANLVSLEDESRSDITASTSINKQGESVFKSISPGKYQIEYDCQNQTQSVSITGKGVLSVLCPVNFAG